MGSKLKVRINVVTETKNELYCDQSRIIQELIQKFRLPYSSKPRIIRVYSNEPRTETIEKFESFSQCRLDDAKRKKVICRWLRLSELIRENSANSALISVTMPIPTHFIEAKQYMAILNVLSDQKN